MPKKGYKQTKEHRKKCAESRIGLLIGKRNPMYGKHISEENKRQHSERMQKHAEIDIDYGMRGKKHSNDSRKKMSETHKRIGTRSPSQKGVSKTEKWKTIMSGKMSGSKNPMYNKQFSEAELKKRSDSMKGKTIGHRLYHPRRSDLWYESKTNGKLCFRSSWELEFAKYLDSLNELWFYEFWQFYLGNKTYTPDFYLPRRELFVEIKGRWYPNEKGKYYQFKEEYPFENILLINHKPPYNNMDLNEI